MKKVFGLLLLLIVIKAEAQTKIDLITQSRNVDFSAATSTKPFKTGTSMPATCITGELFFRTNGPVTGVIYACTATNTWTLQNGSGGLNLSTNGLVIQTATGTVSRSLVAGTGLIVSNGDAQAGNPTIGVDTATDVEAQAGLAASKLMTPERTRQAFLAWNPVPSQSGRAQGLLTTDGTTLSWTWKLINPSSGSQALAGASATITADRLFVNVFPMSTLVLSSLPTIVDGEDGQFLTITNISTTNSVTLPDETVTPGSNLQLGGANMTLAPRQSVSLVFSASLGDWILTQKQSAGGSGGGATGNVTGPSFAVDSQLSLFSGTTGKSLATYTGSGVLKATNGVPSVVSGTATDFIRVDGTSASAGNVIGAASSVDSQISLFSGTTGKSLATYAGSGVLKATNGVPSVVSGTATDFVRVDGTSASAGNVTGVASSVDLQLPLFSGTTGKSLATYTGSGVLKATNGVPSVVSGTATDFVRVDGTSASAGNVLGAASSVDSQISLFSGTTGKSLATYAGSGVLKATNGVPSVVSGTATDFVRVDGTSASAGNVTGAASSVDLQLPLFSGTTGKSLATYTGSGVLKATNGVPSVVSGTATDFVRVDGTSASAGNVTGAASSVDSQISLFNGTTGKIVKAYAGTGVLKASSGAPSVVSGNASDYVRVDGTSSNPLPTQTSKAQSLLTTDGTNASWTWKLIIPTSGTQTLANNTATISADRLYVTVSPSSNLTLTCTAPVIADGQDGQFLIITNVSLTNSVILPDEATCAGSNLRLGGTNLTLAPRQSVTLVFPSTLNDWVRTHVSTASSSSSFTGPDSSVDSQLAVFNGSTGTTVKSSTLSGVLKASNGVPATVTGNDSDFVRVDGTSAAAGGGKQVLSWASTASAISAGGQAFFAPGSAGSSSSSEVARQIIMSTAATVSNLYIRMWSGGSNTVPVVCTLRRNNADTPLTATLPAGATSFSIYTDLTHTQVFAAGDSLGFRCGNANGSVGPSPDIISVLLTF